MGFELNGVIKGVLCNKDGTVDYVFDDAKLDEIIAPLTNDSSESDEDERLFLSSSKDYEVSFEKVHKGKRQPYGHVDKPLRIDLPKDEIIEMYNSGMSIYKIANRYGVSYNTIKRRIELWGIK